MQIPSVEVCLTPKLLELYPIPESIVVVTDVLRATSCMVTALEHGAKCILPVRGIEECYGFKDKGYHIAGERDGKKIETFDLDNSPFSYMNTDLVGQSIAITTTNGTQAIKLAGHAKQVLIGAFLNLRSLAAYLLRQHDPVIIVCAGWKNHPNLEDTLFAGALVKCLEGVFSIQSDAALMASMLYEKNSEDLSKAISHCSHVHRLKNLGLDKDIAFCLEQDLYQVIPILKEDHLIALN